VRPEPLRILAIALVALFGTGCVLWPFPPFVPGERRITVENLSAHDLVVRFVGTDVYPASFAVPAEATGEALLYTSVGPEGVELLSAECEPIGEAALTADAVGLRIDRAAAGIVPADVTADGGRTLVEFLECDDRFGLADLTDAEAALLGTGTLTVLAGFEIEARTISLPDRDVAVLLEGVTYPSEVAVSPDGGRIAYSAYEGTSATSSVFVVAAGGGDPEHIRGDAAGPSWSPDGDRVAMITTDPFEGAALSVHDLAAGTDVEIAVDMPADAIGYGAPSWSPDGTQVALLVPPASVADPFADPTTFESALVVIELASRDIRELGTIESLGPVVWSPDGRYLALDAWPASANPLAIAGAQITLINVETGEQTRLTDAGSASDSGVAWSPDGTQVAFVRTGTFGGTSLMVMPAAGGEPRSLAEYGSTAWASPPTWSPDGERIATVVTGTSITGTLWVIEVATGDGVEVASGVMSVAAWR
jgi:hypothetical protein